MEFRERKSGIVVPKEKPDPTKRQRGRLEIQEEERREKAKEAMSQLWDAMDLSSRQFIRVEVYELYEQLYWFIGKVLLGDDVPEKEQPC